MEVPRVYSAHVLLVQNSFVDMLVYTLAEDNNQRRFVGAANIHTPVAGVAPLCVLNCSLFGNNALAKLTAEENTPDHMLRSGFGDVSVSILTVVFLLLRLRVMQTELLSLCGYVVCENDVQVHQ